MKAVEAHMDAKVESGAANRILAYVLVGAVAVGIGIFIANCVDDVVDAYERVDEVVDD